jgi:hypothetical protein
MENLLAYSPQFRPMGYHALMNFFAKPPVAGDKPLGLGSESQNSLKAALPRMPGIFRAITASRAALLNEFCRQVR